MKKILAILLAAGLIIGFVNYRQNNKPTKELTNEKELEIEQTTDVDLENSVENSIEDNNSKPTAESIDTSNPERLAETSINYVKNNDYKELSEDDKSYIYGMVKDGISQMGYSPDDFSYEDLNNLYNECQSYIIENNVDANNLSLIDQAKLYNILQTYMKNK